MTPIIDSHLDLSWNALSFNRDLCESIETIRSQEAGMSDERCRGKATVCLPEMRKGGIEVCIATLLARAKRDVKAAKRTDLDFATQEICCATARGQLEYYNLLVARGEIQIIRDAKTFRGFWDQRRQQDDANAPIGVVLSMEGADAILSPAHVQNWWDLGLRAVGLAHYGSCVYAQGTGKDGPLAPGAPALLQEIERVGMILDMTHTADTGFFQALDIFGGRVLASHNNCRALVPGDRQYSDEQIKLLVSRDAVIGVVLDAWMLSPGWKHGESTNDKLGLAAVADQIDHICQLAGNCRHVGIGSDLDGGFGFEQTPCDLNTIADLQKLEPILLQRGYSPADIAAIFHGNWLRFLAEALPAY